MKNFKTLLTAVGIVVLMAASEQVSAQKSSGNIMEVGTITLNLGVGFGRAGYGYTGYNGYGYNYGNGFGTKLAVERGMWEAGPGVITLGGEIGGAFSTSGSYKSNIIVVAARSAYHYGWNVPSLDTYGGFSLGPGFRSSDYQSGQNSTSTNHDVVPAFGFFLGGSYFLSSNIGVNAEFGYDITVFQAGVVFKLN